MNILLVEDDAALAQATAEVLRARGWRVDVSAAGEPVPRSVRQDDYDVLVLDIGLPGIDGLEVLRRVRAQGSHLPVLMLTARASIEDRVLGLETGADDYLVKPFAVPELLARLRALVRRHEFRRGGALALGRLRFDGGARRAFIGDAPLRLTARESVVLEYLLQQIGHIVARERLISQIADWNAAASNNALDLLISRLRAKIAPAGVRLRPVRGLGYMIEAGVAA
ncbi:MAG: response regulator transcription factor [Burkholderiaceae bacterium]|jgi:DNA-binding response OmpR family regulator|nr:response regulator transcription factor [Burkholderiaceae bacterium]